MVGIKGKNVCRRRSFFLWTVKLLCMLGKSCSEPTRSAWEGCFWNLLHKGQQSNRQPEREDLGEWFCNCGQELYGDISSHILIFSRLNLGMLPPSGRIFSKRLYLSVFIFLKISSDCTQDTQRKEEGDGDKGGVRGQRGRKRQRQRNMHFVNLGRCGHIYQCPPIPPQSPPEDTCHFPENSSHHQGQHHSCHWPQSSLWSSVSTV